SRVGGGPGHQLFESLELRAGRDDDSECVARDADDVADIGGRVPSDFLRVWNAKGSEWNLRYDISLGARRLQRDDAERAAGTRLVLDHDRLRQVLGGGFGQRAHRDIGRSAGWPGADERDRLGGENFGLRREGGASCRGTG